ncbi:MAG TPA: NAD-dependent epimerase/dehydratase family protein [Nitrospinaceae bacterium]|nr:NAD-dependent epimerase/dehydratase family protein [Nitrospinaceae bacterium]
MGHKILVTGGAGYLGSTLAPELLRAGHEVTVLDNFMYNQNSLAHICHDTNFKLVRGDVRLKSDLTPLLKEAEIIIPLAALVGTPICDRDPVGAKTINHDSMLELFDLVGDQQCILMPTTNSAYGTGDENNYCTEESELRPISSYAKEKVAVEKALMMRKNSISFRLATVFGMSPRMRIDLLVNDFTYRATNDRFLILFESHFKRNFIHVRDVTKAFLHSIENYDKMRGEVFNVGLSEANLSKKELCNAIQKHVPDFIFQEAAIGKDPDQRNYIVSNKKIEGSGFKPDKSLDAGIIELIKGYRMIKNSRYGNI